MKRLSLLFSALFLLMTPAPAWAGGDLTRKVNRLPALEFGDGEENDYAVNRRETRIETGKLYVLPIVAKGYKEYRLEAPKFFQNIWISQVVIEDLEVHATIVQALEFDSPGEMELFFIAIRPGSYEWTIEGFEDKGMSGRFIVE